MNEGFGGIVLGEIDKNEDGKTLIILSGTKGKVYVNAPGAHKLSCSYLKSAQMFAYSRFFVDARHDYYVLKEADLLQDFFAIRNDYTGFCLANYIAELALSVTVDASDCKEILSLTLNTMYCIEKQLYTPCHIKSVYEMRLAALLGFAPDLEACPFCETENKDKAMTFDIENGFVCCDECLPEDAEKSLCFPVATGALLGMRYICEAEPNKVFSFSLDDKSALNMYEITEKYLHLRTERKYKSLKVFRDALKGIK